MNKNYIGGEWVTGVDVNLNINPSDTNDVIGEYARADTTQAQAAVEAAFDAQAAWAKFTAEQRSDALDRIGSEVLARREELGRLLAREEGKTLAEGVGKWCGPGACSNFSPVKPCECQVSVCLPFALASKLMYAVSLKG